MSPELNAPAAFLLAAVTAYLVTPVTIRVAVRTGFFDRPSGYKGHRAPTPYLGGTAIVAGFLVAALLFGGGTTGNGVIVACAVGIWLLGTVDDRFSLPLLPRVGVEVGVALLIWATGHGWSALNWAPGDLALTMLWVVGVTNAFNLMDNMDGTAATTAAVSALGAGALALVNGQTTLAALCLAIAGACAGFLPHNLAGPARSFMGDGGSLTVGFLVACASMAAAAGNSPGLSAVVVAALLVSLVILDTGLVTFSRGRAGRQILLGGNDHLTHRLARRFGSPRRVAALLGAVQLGLCAATVAVATIQVLWIVTVGSVAVTLGVLIAWTLESARWTEPAAPAVPELTDAMPHLSPAPHAAEPAPGVAGLMVAASAPAPSSDTDAGRVPARR